MITVIENQAKPILVVRPRGDGPLVIVPTSQPGPRGATGAAGAGFSYTHDQPFADDTWTIVHNLGGFPNVSAAQLVGPNEWQEVYGDVHWISDTTVTIQFGMAVSGKAFLS